MSYQKAILNRALTSKRISFLIHQSNYTFDELATMLDLQSPRVIYDWISGTKLPGVENLYNLAQIFNVKMEDCLVMR